MTDIATQFLLCYLLHLTISLLSEQLPSLPVLSCGTLVSPIVGSYTKLTSQGPVSLFCDITGQLISLSVTSQGQPIVTSLGPLVSTAEALLALPRGSSQVLMGHNVGSCTSTDQHQPGRGQWKQFVDLLVYCTPHRQPRYKQTWYHSDGYAFLPA